MDILIHPSAQLREKAAEVDPANDQSLLDLVKTMARTMYDAPGVGLAAPQLGVMKRVIVYDVSGDEQRPVALCNPVIAESSEEREVGDEGCLSLPGISVPVERSVRITCEATSLQGNKVSFEAEGFHARVLQHEIDHLDGFLIIDRATPEERKAALERYRDALAQGAVPGQTRV
jgi:peptide deformylase